MRHTNYTVNYANRRGEANPQAKVTEQDVRDIRLKVAAIRASRDQAVLEYESAMEALYQRYKVSKTVISYIVNRRTWTHVK
jgi:hypothetical protein